MTTPGGQNMQLVNGGYGIKHPLLRHNDVSARNQQLGQHLYSTSLISTCLQQNMYIILINFAYAIRETIPAVTHHHHHLFVKRSTMTAN